MVTDHSLENASAYLRCTSERLRTAAPPSVVILSTVFHTSPHTAAFTVAWALDF